MISFVSLINPEGSDWAKVYGLLHKYLTIDQEESEASSELKDHETDAVDDWNDYYNFF